MWRATVLAAGLAVALGGATGDLAAQGRGNGNGKGKASERYERKDDRDDSRANVGRGVTGRATGRATTSRSGTAARGVPEVLQGSRDGRYDPRRDDGRYDPRRDDRRWDDRRWDDRDSDRDSDRYRYGDRYGKKNGPKFCQNGQGHPVHGRQWCVQKGYGVGNDRWGRASWPDVIFGRQTQRGSLGGSVLEQILGRAVYGRLGMQARQYGGGSLYGNWLMEPGGPRILQVYAGSRPLAEFIDGNRDGRAEVVMLNFGR